MAGVILDRVDDGGWEARMAARARDRRAEREAPEMVAGVERMLAVEVAVQRIGRDGWDWLNGWPRQGETGVLIGTAVYCLGCGYFCGLTSVFISEDWQAPGPAPDWPLTQADCPIHAR